MSREHKTRRYETMVVLRADLQEAGVKEQLERIRKLLEANGGTVGGMHEWGLRELAYEIEKERRGYYVLVEYTGTVTTVSELERSLKLSDVVLRFVSVRQEKGAPPAPPSLRRDDEPVEALAELDTSELDTDEDEEGLGAEGDLGDVE